MPTESATDPAKKVRADYISEICGELTSKFPGLVINTTEPEEILFVYKIEQRNEKTLVCKEEDGKSNLVLDCAPYITNIEERFFTVQLDHPESKEMIINHFQQGLKKWLQQQRELVKQHLDSLAVWETALDDLSVR